MPTEPAIITVASGSMKGCLSALQMLSPNSTRSMSRPASETMKANSSPPRRAMNTPEGATLISFDEPAAMFLALESGDVDAILQDLPVNGYRSTQDDSMVVTELFPTGEQYGFAVDPDNAGLAEAVNGQLAALRTAGTYDEIFAKWFGE